MQTARFSRCVLVNSLYHIVFSIALSTFSPVPFTRDDVLWFQYPGKHLDDISNMDKRVLLSGIFWPREPGQVPVEVFGHEALTQPSGFLLIGEFGNLNFGIKILRVHPLESIIIPFMPKAMDRITT